MRKLSEQALSVLRDGLQIDVEGRRAVIVAQLERRLYAEVNEALSEMGGKWDRKAKAHLFGQDPWEQLADVIAQGGYVRQKDELGWFPTPKAIADRLAEIAAIDQGDHVLEPSAGEGALVRAAMEAGAGRVIACEISQARAAKLASIGEHPGCVLEVLCGDFMASGFAPASFDRVVMNPPFAKSQDIRHVMNAWPLLKAGGILAAITAPGWQFRTNREHADFRAFVEEHAVEVESLPAGAFKESGTDVRTVMFALRK